MPRFIRGVTKKPIQLKEAVNEYTELKKKKISEDVITTLEECGIDIDSLILEVFKATFKRYLQIEVDRLMNEMFPPAIYEHSGVIGTPFVPMPVPLIPYPNTFLFDHVEGPITNIDSNQPSFTLTGGRLHGP